MAKGQKKSNREAKKPKQVKAKPAEPATMAARMGAAQAGRPSKK